MERYSSLRGMLLGVALIAGLTVLPSANAAGSGRGDTMAGMAMSGGTGTLAVRVSRCSPTGCVNLRLVRHASGWDAIDGPATAGVSGVAIMNFSFRPMTITVPLSSTVFWINKDAVTHTTTSVATPPVWDSGPLGPNHFFAHKFTHPGFYFYRCNIHQSMRGLVVVKRS